MKAEEIVRYLPERMEAALRKADPDWNQMEEIRLRVKRPLLFYWNGREWYLSPEGRFIPSDKKEGRNPIVVEYEDIQKILARITGYSLYAYEEEMKQGFLTLEGGHRVGLSGNAVLEGSRMKTMKYISYLNIRVAHEKKGCAAPVLPKLLEKGRLCHTLIISPPGCGKTTLLRDMIRQISNGFSYETKEEMHRFFRGKTVGVVDERNEIGALIKGIPVNDLGMRTDILDGCPKPQGIFVLLRSMAPQVIAVDEIGSMEDFEAVRQAVYSGCTILATAHGHSREEFTRREAGAAFLKEHIFERYILLSERCGKGTIENIVCEEEAE